MALGATMGVAGSVLGFFFGAVSGSLVFGLLGAAMSWFASRDINDAITSIDSKNPALKSKINRVLTFIGRALYLAFGIVVIVISAMFTKGLKVCRKKTSIIPTLPIKALQT
jgi:hypothetical protein